MLWYRWFVAPYLECQASSWKTTCLTVATLPSGVLLITKSIVSDEVENIGNSGYGKPNNKGDWYHRRGEAC